jgi:hypothetical protein
VRRLGEEGDKGRAERECLRDEARQRETELAQMEAMERRLMDAQDKLRAQKQEVLPAPPHVPPTAPPSAALAQGLV